MYKDLIRRSDLLKEADKRRDEVNYHDDAEICIGMDAIIEVIEDMDTVDAEPVRHGRWIHGWTFMPLPKGVIWANCSLCDMDYNGPDDKANYCPNCGAKMDLED